MNKFIVIAAGAIALLTLADTASAATGHVRARGANGMVAAGSSNGNSYVRGRGHTTNSDGSLTAASGGAFKLNNGAYGARASTTTVNPDGSATHSGSAYTAGARGTASTTGGFTRNADGTVSGARDTDITAANGNGYSGSTTYATGSGVSHSGSCHDASGATIACPGR